MVKQQNYSPSYSPSSSVFNKSPSYGNTGAAGGHQGTTPHSMSKHSPKYTSEHSPYSPSAIGSASLHNPHTLHHSGQPGHSAGGAGGGSSIGGAPAGPSGGAAYIPSGTANPGVPQMAYNPASPVYKQENSSDEEEEKKDKK